VGETWRLARPLTHDERAMFDGYQLGRSDLEDDLPVEHHAVPWESKDDVVWVIPPPWHDAPRTDPLPDASLLGELEYSAAGYFGNEGSPTTFYVAGALLARIPPEKRRAAWRG
jgi:hypothetical protein